MNSEVYDLLRKIDNPAVQIFLKYAPAIPDGTMNALMDDLLGHYFGVVDPWYGSGTNPDGVDRDLLALAEQFMALVSSKVKLMPVTFGAFDFDHFSLRVGDGLHFAEMKLSARVVAAGNPDALAATVANQLVTRYAAAKFLRGR